jgi:hypothetical protein
MNTLSALNRREFVQTAATAALAGFGSARAAAAPRSKAPAGTGRHPVWVDVNVTLGRWPFRRLPFDETPALVGKLRQQGVTAAWRARSTGFFITTWRRPTRAWRRIAAGRTRVVAPSAQ